MGKRLLLLSKTTGYQAQAFRRAAERLGAPLTLGSDRCRVLEDPWLDGAFPVRFEQPEESARMIAAATANDPPAGIVALGDQASLTGACAAELLGIAFHPPESVRAACDKFQTRLRLSQAELPSPRFALVSTHEREPTCPAAVGFPCVLKPLGLSGGRGVIRADGADSFHQAFQRIGKLLEQPEVAASSHADSERILVESFIPGREYALEAIMDRGRFRVLALFDKPDPLDGPYFEETIYVTPSRLDQQAQARIAETAERAARAVGLFHGPVHAEMRVNAAGVWMLELAPRPIGGLCSRALRFGRRRSLDGDASLEELIIRHALGMDVDSLEREPGASGVMMIPAPAEGVLQRVDGVDEARRVAAVEDVVITAKAQEKIRPWPESNSYPGFIFARAESPALVEAALREAHARLKFVVNASLPVIQRRR